MNSILSVIPAIAATVFLFLSSLDGLSMKSDHQTTWTTPTIDTRVETEQQPLQSAGVAQGQLVFAGVPGASNYALLVNPQMTTLNVIRVDGPELIQTAQVDLQDTRPTRIAFQKTSGVDGTVPVPEESAASPAVVKVRQRVYLDIGLTVSGWNNAVAGSASETHSARTAASDIPPAAPVTEP